MSEEDPRYLSTAFHENKLNISTPDLTTVLKPPKRVSNPNNHSFVTTVAKDGTSSTDLYDYTVTMDWVVSLDFLHDMRPGDYIDSKTFTCPKSCAKWRIRVEPHDMCSGEPCLTVRVVAVELALLGAVIGYFIMQSKPSPRLRTTSASKVRRVITGGAVWRLCDARGHVLLWRRDLENAERLNLLVQLQYSALNLSTILLEPAVSLPQEQLEVATTYTDELQKYFCLTVHWKIRGFPHLRSHAAAIIHSPYFGVRVEEVLFRLLLYPNGALCDCTPGGQLRVALHALHLPKDVRGGGLRIEFALGLATEGRKIPQVVKRADRAFTEGAGWGFRFGKRNDFEAEDQNLSVRGEVRFCLPREEAGEEVI